MQHLPFPAPGPSRPGGASHPNHFTPRLPRSRWPAWLLAVFILGLAVAGLQAAAPAITAQPVSQTALEGQNATFSVTATGDAPLAYQWKRGTTNITSGTNATLTLSNLVVGQTATNYTVMVTNVSGSVTSRPTALTVLRDLDHDLMADVWELAYGLNTNNAADAMLDPDGDGVINRAEFEQGTHPTNATSRQSAVVAVSHTSNSVVGLTLAGTYGLAQLSVTNYQITDGTNAIAVISALPGTQTRFVRLTLERALVSGQSYFLQVFSPPFSLNFMPGVAGAGGFGFTICPADNRTNCPCTDVVYQVDCWEPTGGATVTYNVTVDTTFCYSAPCNANVNPYNASSLLLIPDPLLDTAGFCPKLNAFPNPHVIIISASDGIHPTVFCTNYLWMITNAPTLICPGDITNNICGTNVAVTYPAPTVTDGTLVGCTPASGSTFPLGPTVVTCTATNLCSTNTCSFTVLVNQIGTVAIGPCPGNITNNICGTNLVVTYANPPFSGGTLVGCVPASGSTFPLGPTVVTCRATNLCSTNTCTFTVVVNQIGTVAIGPCPGNITNNICGTNLVVTYANPPFSGGTLVGCVPASGSTFPLGPTVVTCRATNLCSTNTCTFTVVVNQIGTVAIGPCPGNITNNICGTNLVVTYANPPFSGGTLVGCVPASGSTFPLGPTVVTCRATNLCSTNTCTFTVVVNQIGTVAIGPCPGNITNNICGTNLVVTYANPPFSGGTLVGCVPASGSTFPLGPTVVTCRATNLCSTNTCTFTVVVNQIGTVAIGPCPGNITNNICGTNLVVTYANPPFSGGTLVGCVPASGSTFPLGPTVVTCRATNLCSTNTCTFTVVVNQIGTVAIGPCPGNITNNICGTNLVVTYANPPFSGGTLVGCVPASGSTFPLGPTVVTCRATNLCSTNTCTFTVVVNQIGTVAIGPCPGNITNNICGTNLVVTYANPPFSGGTLVGCVPASGSTFPLGPTVVTCRATNLCSTNTCTFTVVVNQIGTVAIGPCPGNITNNICGTNLVVTYANPPFSGGTLVGCVPASGSTFPLGPTVVTCRATNLCSTNTCTFTVVVNQIGTVAIGPCPGNITNNICGTNLVVTYANPPFSGGTLVGCVPASGSTFPLGPTVVTCRATNLCSTNTCTFTVVVNQIGTVAIGPCPGNITNNICGTNLVVTYANPPFSGGTLVGCVPASGSTFPLGPTVVTCRATNLCSTNTCTFTVVVNQIGTVAIGPCPGNITNNICGTNLVVTYANPPFSGGTLVGCVPASGSTFPLGPTVVTCRATNLCSTNTCTFTVVVNQIGTVAIGPCPGNITNNICGTNLVVTYANPPFSGGTLVGCVPASGSTFPLGPTVVTCRATNLCSTNTCTFTVVVNQIGTVAIGPCPGNITNNICGTNLVVTYATPPFSGGTLVGCVPASGSTFPLGPTVVTCRATNLCSTNTCTFTVVVNQIGTVAIGPCPGNITNNICGTNLVVTYANPPFSGGTLVGCVPASGSTFPLGPTVVTCRATNLCSTNTCTFTVVVNQIGTVAIGPCPGNITNNICGTNLVVTYANPPFSGGTLVGCVPASGSTFPLGPTVVTCRATNLCSTNTCTFTVVVNQIGTVAIGPCPGNITNNICGTNLVVTYANPPFSGGTLVGCVPASGSTFPLGPTVVTCRATNLCSTNTCTFTVVVNQIGTVAIGPCPGNITNNICGTNLVVTYANPPFSGGTLVGCVPASGSTFPLGPTVVTCRATNLCSTNTCTFTVVVNQIGTVAIGPCPGNITNNICGTNLVVTYANPPFSGGTLVGCVPASGSTFPLGPTVVTCRATNLCSTNTCTFTVVVNQIAGVAIGPCPGNITTNICGTNVVVTYANPPFSGGTLVGCVPASGSTFPLGPTVVTCTATNLCSTNRCMFTITVISNACDCLGVSNEHLACAPNVPGKLNYSLDVKNNTGVPVKYVFLVPKNNCFSFMPSVFILNPLLLPGQTITLTTMINLTGNCPTNLCFFVTAHDSNFVQCCSIMHCVANPGCCRTYTNVCHTGRQEAPPALFAPGTPDPNYLLISAPPGACTGPAQVLNPFTLPSSWVPNGPNSQWIGAGPNANCQSGVYHYRRCFYVPCTNGASLQGQWTVASAGAMLLNGQRVSSLPFAPGPSSSWHPVSITTGFLCGTNCLDFYVTNILGIVEVNPTGFRAELANVFNDCCCEPARPMLSVFSGMSSSLPIAVGGADTQFALSGPPNPVVIDPLTFPGSWAPNSPLSQWIGPDQNNVAPFGLYGYTVQFTVPCPANRPLNASLTGRWMAYESGDMFLNGTLINSSANAWTPINITSGFVPGVNTLTFSVDNQPGPIDVDTATGLRLELTGTYSCCECTNSCEGYPPLLLTCPPHQTIPTCSAPVPAYYSATAAGGAAPVNVTCTPPSGTPFPYGVSVVTCTATDRCGTRTNCSFTVNVQYAGSPPCIPNPIIVQVGTNVVISWVGPATNIVLEATTNLNRPIVWAPETQPPIEFNGRTFITIPAAGAQRFFRLRGPAAP